MGKTYVDDIGTRIRTTMSEDITGYSAVTYYIQNPSGTEVTKTCVVEDVTNGIVYYDTVSGDLDEEGIYKIQTLVDMGATQFMSETQQFRVYGDYD